MMEPEDAAQHQGDENTQTSVDQITVAIEAEEEKKEVAPNKEEHRASGLESVQPINQEPEPQKEEDLRILGEDQKPSVRQIENKATNINQVFLEDEKSEM